MCPTTLFKIIMPVYEALESRVRTLSPRFQLGAMNTWNYALNNLRAALRYSQATNFQT